MSYCGVEDVLKIIPNREINDESTVISTGDVENLIKHADNIINLKLKNAGLYSSVSGYSEELKTIEALLVAGLVEARLKADDGGEDDELPNNALYKEGIKLLDELCQNNILQPIDEPETAINSFMDSEDELEARFNINKRMW